MPSPNSLESLTSRLALSKTSQQAKFDLFNSLDEIYHVTKKEDDNDSQIHSPDSWSNVETIAPKLLNKRPTLIFDPRPSPFNKNLSEEQQDQIKQNKASVWEHWWDKDGAFVKNVAWIKGTLRHGTKIVRAGWKYETQELSSYVYGEDGRPAIEAQIQRDEQGNIVQIIPLEIIDTTNLTTAQKKFAEEVTEEVTFDDATMDTISSYDFFIDPEAKDIQGASWLIYRYRTTIDELKETGRFTNLKDLEGLIGENSDNQNAEKSRVISGLAPIEDDSTVDRVTCYEMWQKGKKGRQVCTIAAGKIEIEKWKANQFRHGKYPFIRNVDSLVDEEFWGKGEIEPVRYFQMALDTYHSMDVANRVQALDNKWKSEGDIDDWELFNGRVIHTNPKLGNDANPIVVPDLTSTSVGAISLQRETMNNALGISDILRGESDPNNTTGVGLGIATDNGNARMSLKSQMYEEALKELGEQIISLYQQHKTDYFDIVIEGETGQKETKSLTPADIAGESNIEVEAGSSRQANKEAERADAMQIFQLTQPVQDKDPGFALEVTNFVLDKFEGASKVKDALEKAYTNISQQQQIGQEQQAQMQTEQGSVDDHQAKMQYFNNQEKQINDQISQAQKNQPQAVNQSL